MTDGVSSEVEASVDAGGGGGGGGAILCLRVERLQIVHFRGGLTGDCPRQTASPVRVGHFWRDKWTALGENGPLRAVNLSRRRWPTLTPGPPASPRQVQGSGFRIQGSGLRVQGSGFRVHGSGFRVDAGGGAGEGGATPCLRV